MRAAQTENMLALAQSRTPDDRERLLNGLVELCTAAQNGSGHLPVHTRRVVEGLFITLVKQAEHEIRENVAEKLAEATWAPSALINILALDEIEIAEPIIAYSPVLGEEDLLQMMVQATLDHQVAIARRPRLTSGVVDAILETGDPAVMAALASNDTADISQTALNAMVEHARRIVAMRSPLARHPRLSSEMAVRLHTWVGESLKTAIVARFRLDPVMLEKAMADATRTAAGFAPSPPVEAERDDMDRGLVEKLKSAGELRSGYLLRALREGRLNLFLHILASLGGFELAILRRCIDSDRPELLALACAGVSIDRVAFPTILALVREWNQQKPGGGTDGLNRAMGAFGPFDPETARAAFNQAAN